MSRKNTIGISVKILEKKEIVPPKNTIGISMKILEKKEIVPQKTIGINVKKMA